MQPEAQDKKEEKKEQQQNPVQGQQQVPQNQAVEKKEENSPHIKTEENQENWKVFRAQRDIDRKAKQEAEKMAAQKAAEAEALKAALEAITNKPVQRTKEPEYGYSEESDDEVLQKKIDSAVEQRLERERKKYQEEQREREKVEIPTKLRQAFPDFSQVCSAENTDYLEYHYPEVAAAFEYMPDSFEKWANVYKAVKRFVPNTDTRKEQARAEKNMQKPNSISASGATQGNSAMPQAKLDEQRKSDNWARMQRTLKGLN